MRLAAILAALMIAGCSTEKGFLGTGLGAAPPPPPPTPEGFAKVHWIAYAGGFLMMFVGAALFWFGQRKNGVGLALTGICTFSLAAAAAYYGKALAFASFILLGVGIVATFAYMGWYAWKYARKKDEFKEVVMAANGSLPVESLNPATKKAVEAIKKGPQK